MGLIALSAFNPRKTSAGESTPQSTRSTAPNSGAAQKIRTDRCFGCKRCSVSASAIIPATDAKDIHTVNATVFPSLLFSNNFVLYHKV